MLARCQRQCQLESCQDDCSLTSTPSKTTTPEAIGLPLNSFLCNDRGQGCLHHVNLRYLHTTAVCAHKQAQPAIHHRHVSHQSPPPSW